jgi:acetylornithine deacetylase/succinyl-diaminopimelate desuccinylase-like protein
MMPGNVTALVAALVVPQTPFNCELVKAELELLIHDSAVVVSITSPPGLPPQLVQMLNAGTRVDPDDARVKAAMAAIRGAVAEEMPDVVVVHSLFQVLSDCAAYSLVLNLPCIGYSPVRMPDGEYVIDIAHGNDEYIPLQGFRTGLRAYAKTVVAYAA